MDTGRLITRRTVMSATCVATVAAMMSPAPTAEAKTDLGRPRVMWQQCVERALQCFPTGGGYHTGRNIPPGFRQTAWTGLDRAVRVTATGVCVDPYLATPSFCSSATYLLLLKSLELYEKTCGVMPPRQEWEYLKPYTVDNRPYPIQNDGVGAWGRANANGPGMAELAHELKIGTNLYIGTTGEYADPGDRNEMFASIRRYDFMKIFWNDEIGKDERGHMVVVLGRSSHSNCSRHRVGTVRYWSSNGSHTDINGGYGIKCVSEDKIHRAVVTRVDRPWNVWNTEVMGPTDVCAPLAEIAADRNMTPDELKQLVEAKSCWPRRFSGSHGVHERYVR